MIETEDQYAKAKTELRDLETQLSKLQEEHPNGEKGFTKAGVRKMIARLHEELVSFNGAPNTSHNRGRFLMPIVIRQKRTPKLCLPVKLVATLIACLVAQTSIGSVDAFAQITNAIWTGNGDATNWENDSNWSSSMFPSNSAAEFFAATIDSTPGASAALTTSNLSIDALMVGEANTLMIQGGGELTIASGRPGSGIISNDGTCLLYTSPSPRDRG